MQRSLSACSISPLLSGVSGCFFKKAELIQLMDKEGIGTDATMATHIATIQQRGYATCDAR